MIAALAQLSDADAAQVLSQNPRFDHDGSTFPAADIAEIRAHRARLQVLTNNRQEEPADDWATKLAEEFRAARDEQSFHRLFTDVRDDPAIGDDLIAGVAHLLTGEQHETREAALGAIEGEFHGRERGLAQEHTPTQGGGR